MKLDFNLQVTQKQGIALTAQVQQAIKLLHMTNMEIQEYVDDQFQDNPFIETTGEFEEQKHSEKSQSDRVDVDKSLEENPYNQSQNENKLAQENQFETGEGYIPKSTVAKADLDFDAISLVAEESKSLYAHCLDYINNLNLSTSENLIALRLLEELEPTGWISEDIRLIAQEIKIEIDVLETEPGFKGDTSTNTLKSAKLSNGLEVKVPLFIEEGDFIKVDTRTNEYQSRVNK